MAWARRTGATLNGAANTGASTDYGDLGAATVAGDRVIAVIGGSSLHSAGQFAVTGITDTQGNSWARDFLRDQDIGGLFFGALEVWSCVANGTSVTHITVSYSFNLTATGGCAVAIGAYSGIDTTAGAGAAVDISVGADGTAGSPADSGTSGTTTAAANELKIGAYSDDGANKTLSAGTLDTTYSVFVKKDASSTEQALLEDADSGSSGSTIRSTVTWASGNNNWIMAALVYKLAGAAPPAQGPLGSLKSDRPTRPGPYKPMGDGFRPALYKNWR